MNQNKTHRCLDHVKTSVLQIKHSVHPEIFPTFVLPPLPLGDATVMSKI